MKKTINLIKMVPLLFIFGPLFISTNLFAADNKSIESSIKSTQLSTEDTKIYNDVLDLINEFNGAGDNLERAQAKIIDLAKRNPQSAYPYAAQAELEVRNKNQSQAYTLALKATKINPNISDAYVTIAYVNIAQNDIYSARTAADKAIAIDPNNPSAMVMMAQVANKFFKYDESEVWYRKAIENQKSVIRKSNIYGALGYMLAYKNPADILGATEAYTMSAKLAFDKSPWNLINAADFLNNHTDHYDQAIEYAEQALKIMDFGMAHRNLGLAQYYKWGDSMQNPQKYKNAKVKPLDPKAITLKTGVTPQMAFLSSASYPNGSYTAIHLLKKGVIKDKDIDLVPDGYNGTALYNAAGWGNIDLVKALVAKGANVNAKDLVTKQTALGYAVADQNFDMVKFLVEHGARVNTMSNNGMPINYSFNFTKGYSPKIFEYLLENGVDPTLPDHRGEILITNAVLYSKVHAVQLLINKYKVDVNTISNAGAPILAIAAVHYEEEARAIIRLLLKAGANPWVKYSGSDVLNTIKVSGNSPALKSLFAENASILTEARKSFPKPANFD